MNEPQTIQVDLTRIVTAMQEMIKASYLIQQTLLNGVTINSQLAITTVAALPATAPLGSLRYASNGRNSGQGPGAGTGTMVVGNGSVWNASWSGLQVVA